MIVGLLVICGLILLLLGFPAEIVNKSYEARPRSLEALLRKIVGGNHVLNPRIVMEADDLVMTEEICERLERAVDTALVNVEQHAVGASVVVAASADSRHITVTVLASGPGFSSPLHFSGFGIREILDT